MKSDTEESIKCPVLQIYYLFGKKWACPLIANLKSNKCYSFEEIVKLSSRQINRTLLSNLLKEMIEVNILTNKKNCYSLSKKGMEIKRILEDIKELVLKEYSKRQICTFQDNCLVKTFKE